MTHIERQIAEEIAKTNGLSMTKLGLRFDKVAIRLLANLRASAAQVVPNDKTLIVTITAPVKLPAKTRHELEGQIKSFLKSGNRAPDYSATIFQNQMSIRIVTSSSKQGVKFAGLVHNPNIEAKWLLDLATQWLIEG